MAFQYAKLGMAALMAVPAMAAPMPQNVVTVYATAASTQMVYVDQNGHVVEGPAQQAHPTQAPTAASSSSAAPSSSASVVSIQNVQPSSLNFKPSSQPSSVAAPSSHAAASSTAAAAPSNPSGGTSTGGSKKGLVYAKNIQNLAQATQIAASSNGAVTWMYNWEGYPDIAGTGSDSYDVNGVEFVPMLHTKDDIFVQAWKSASPGPQGKGAKHALFLNEPDNAQSACDAGAAAALYKSTYAPGAPSARLGGPATTGGTGAPWLTQFLNACKDCKIDFMPYHYYSSSTDLSDFKAAVQNIHQISGNKPMWITEFGLTAVRDGGNFSPQQRAAFIKQASEWMDSQNYIERYSPYQVSTDGSDDSMKAGNDIAKSYLSV